MNMFSIFQTVPHYFTAKFSLIQRERDGTENSVISICDPHELPVLTCTQRAACLDHLTEWKLTTCHCPFLSGATCTHLASLNADCRADSFLAQLKDERGVYMSQPNGPRHRRSPETNQTNDLLSAHLWVALMSNHIQIGLEEASGKPTSMQIGLGGGLPSRTCPRVALPSGLNPPWACGHVEAHHSADRQVPEWGRPWDWQTSLIAIVQHPHPRPPLWFNCWSQAPLA